MTANTAINALPYPQLSDVKDEVAQFSAFSAVADNRYVPRYANASVRNAANPSPVQGQLVYLNQEALLTGRLAGSVWTPELTPRFVQKTIPQSVASNATTFVPDSQLKVSLLANSTYYLEVVLVVTGVTVTSGGGISTVYPALSGLTVVRSCCGPTITASNTDMSNAVMNLNGIAATSANNYGTQSTSQAVGVYENLTITTSASAVNCVLNWNQVVSSATPTTVLADSYIKYWKIS